MKHSYTSICLNCGNEFSVPANKSDRKRIFCSGGCRATYTNNIRYPDKSWMETKRNCLQCGKELVFTKKQRAYKQKFCSLSCKSKYNIENGIAPMLPALRGEKHGMWKSDRSTVRRWRKRTSYELMQFRKNVLERDGNTCQLCGENNIKTLQAHHIYGYTEHRELGCDIDNGVTLCLECHKRYHSVYGRKGFNPVSFINLKESLYEYGGGNDVRTYSI